MIDVAESISSFSPHVPPADQLITQTYGQLQALIKEAVAEAIAPLEARIEALEMDRDLAADRDLNQLRLINSLREQIQPGPLPMQKDRSDILRALLAANDGKMLAKDARKKMHLSKQAFTNLLATMDNYIDSKPYRLDKRQRVLMLK
jgi:hypothetical protein